MKKTEICIHCNIDYVPTRRGVQKFCSKSCKSRYWYLKQDKNSKEISDKAESHIVKGEARPETMSWAGVGNAAAGAAAVGVVKSLLTPQENRAATKKDIQELKSLINGGRYLPVNNAQNDTYGRKPYYDLETGNVVFFY